MTQVSITPIVTALNAAPDNVLLKLWEEKERVSLEKVINLPTQEVYLHGHKVELTPVDIQLLALESKENMVRDCITAMTQVRKIFTDKGIEVQAITPQTIFDSIVQTCNLHTMVFDHEKPTVTSSALCAYEKNWMHDVFSMYDKDKIRHIALAGTRESSFRMLNNLVGSGYSIAYYDSVFGKGCLPSSFVKYINQENPDFIAELGITKEAYDASFRGYGRPVYNGSIVCHNLGMQEKHPVSIYGWISYYSIEEIVDHFFLYKKNDTDTVDSILEVKNIKIPKELSLKEVYNRVYRSRNDENNSPDSLVFDIEFPKMPDDIQKFLFNFKKEFPQMKLRTTFDAMATKLTYFGRPVEDIFAARHQWWLTFKEDISKSFEEVKKVAAKWDSKLKQELEKLGLKQRYIHTIRTESDLHRAIAIEKDPIFWTPFKHTLHGTEYDLAVIFKSVGLTDNEEQAIKLINDAEPKLFMGVKAN